MSISSFLQGKTSHTPSMIVECWYQSLDGRASVSGSISMFAMSPVYTEIKPARAGLTTFAAQVVEKELVREAREVVKPTSGLHATSKKRGSQRIEWADIGASTVSRVAEIYKDIQSLTWHLMNRIAGKGDDFEEGAGAVRAVKRQRPTEMVCTHALSSLNFTRNNEARLLPLARGLLYFSFSAPADLMAYASRIGDMPTYSTIYNALKGLAAHEATITAALDPNKFAERKQRRLVIGNQQSFHIALHNQSSPVRLYYNPQAKGHAYYPPDTTAFLYYFSPPGKPRIAGELRLRVASSDDHASFESGSDLLKLNGQPWSRSLYQVSKDYRPLYEKLREEGLVSDELDPVLSTFPSKLPRRQVLYTLNDTFIIDFGFFAQRLFIISEQGVAKLRFYGPCVEQRQGGEHRTPYTGSALARFERSTHPVHKGTRTVVLRFLKIITSVKCVIPLCDGHLQPPMERELRRSLRTRRINKLDPPVWSSNIDKNTTLRDLRLLWDTQQS